MTIPLLSIVVAAPFVAAVILLVVSAKCGALVRLVALAGAVVSLAGSIVVANEQIGRAHV